MKHISGFFSRSSFILNVCNCQEWSFKPLRLVGYEGLKFWNSRMTSKDLKISIFKDIYRCFRRSSFISYVCDPQECCSINPLLGTEIFDTFSTLFDTTSMEINISIFKDIFRCFGRPSFIQNVYDPQECGSFNLLRGVEILNFSNDLRGNKNFDFQRHF